MTSWSKIWDEENKAFYYWNQVTDETTWEEPDELKETKDKEPQPTPEKEKPTTTEENSDYYKSKEYYDWYYNTYYPHLIATSNTSGNDIIQASDKAEQQYQDYNLSGYFNAKTGKFQSSTYDAKFNPEQYFDPAARANRQMSVYFDVDRYTEERGVRRVKDEPTRKPSKKEVESYKRKKAQKKLKKAIEKYAD